MMAAKGFCIKVFYTKSAGVLFVGKKVIIKHGKKIFFGKNVTINDNCYINALVSKKIIIGDNFSFGRNSTIDGYGILSNLGEGLIIGNNVGISPNAFISVRGEVVIGDNTIIGPFFSVHPENHIFDDINIEIRKQGITRKGIKIGSDCWIGAKVTILDNVTIGDHCVIAAGSIVTKSFPEYSVIAGVPAKIIKNRKVVSNNENIND